MKRFRLLEINRERQIFYIFPLSKIAKSFFCQIAIQVITRTKAKKFTSDRKIVHCAQ